MPNVDHKHMFANRVVNVLVLLHLFPEMITSLRRSCLSNWHVIMQSEMKCQVLLPIITTTLSLLRPVTSIRKKQPECALQMPAVVGEASLRIKG